MKTDLQLLAHDNMIAQVKLPGEENQHAAGDLILYRISKVHYWMFILQISSPRQQQMSEGNFCSDQNTKLTPQNIFEHLNPKLLCLYVYT